jgi:transcriptional regulator EpsA
MAAHMALLDDTSEIAQRDGTAELLSALGACGACESIEALKEFIRTRLRAVFPHDMAMCGLCDSRSRRILRLINIDFPVAYLQRFVGPDQIVLEGPLRQWLSERAPIAVERRQDAACSDRDDGIARFACHGVVDLSGRVTSYFAFASLDRGGLPCERQQLALIVPHLHEVLARLLTMGYLGEGRDLGDAWPDFPQRQTEPRNGGRFGVVVTEREREILRWVAAGKSNWEIGKILRISEYTVKNHVQSVLKKLSATTRVQAVTKAISGGLIGEEMLLPTRGERRSLASLKGGGRAGVVRAVHRTIS